MTYRRRRRGIDARYQPHPTYGLEELDALEGSAVPIGFVAPSSGEMMFPSSDAMSVRAAGSGGGTVTTSAPIISKLAETRLALTPQEQEAKGVGKIFGLDIPVLSSLYRAGDTLARGGSAGDVVTNVVRGGSQLFGPLGGAAGQLITGGIQSPADALKSLLGVLGGTAGGMLGPGAFLGLGSGEIGSMLGQALGQGVGQAIGAGDARSPLGALLGAGLGGVMPGTGALPGKLGSMANQLFGRGEYGFPPGDLAMQDAAARGFEPGAYNALADYTSKAGRAVVSRITGATLPEIQAIRDMIAHRQAQIQATGEHKLLVSEDQFRARVLQRLANLQAQVSGGFRRAETAGGYQSRYQDRF